MRSYCLSYGPLILFSNDSSGSLISQSGSFSLQAVMRCTQIASLLRSTESWAIVDTASEPGVRGISFRAIPLSSKCFLLLFLSASSSFFTLQFTCARYLVWHPRSLWSMLNCLVCLFVYRSYSFRPCTNTK